ncbi:MAG: WecB/TagA/CpsF family glycosyltransferase [Anderseniella sp.]
MNEVIDRISNAAATRQRLFISTLNLNFIVLAQKDVSFAKSLIKSDLCLTDGVMVKLVAKLLGIPVVERVAGSDILNAIWEAGEIARKEPLKVFLFGGTKEASKKAAKAINDHNPDRICCVGNICPGFGTLEEMSTDAIIDTINIAEPDFIVVALGAQKGQTWIVQNMIRLDAPVVSHLGATINFLAGTVQRAPTLWQRVGLEWLWRIKEEPALAGRYWNDALNLLWLLITRILPLSLWLYWNRIQQQQFSLSLRWATGTGGELTVMLTGALTAKDVEVLTGELTRQSLAKKKLLIDCRALKWIDTAGMGALLMLSEGLQASGGKLELLGLSSQLNWALKTNGLEDLATRHY